MQIKYSNFSVQTKLELPVTADNFYKFPIYVYKGDLYGVTMMPHYLSMSQVEDILSGDEEKACMGIECYIKSLREAASELQYMFNKQNG